MRADRGKSAIVLTIGSARRGGAEGQLVRIAAGLARRGHAVSVIFMVEGGGLTAELDAASVAWSVARLPIRRVSRVGRDILMLVRLGWLMTRARPAVVMAWLPGAIWPTLLVARAASRARRVAALRGGTFERSHLVLRLFRSAIRHADIVTVNAPILEEHARALGARPDRIYPIWNGVTLPPAPAVAVGRQPPVAVVVANYRWYKGHDILVKALRQVTVPLTVRLIGEGDELQRVRQLASELGVLERIVFVEHPADVAAELLGAQFAIHPSLTEGMSNAILEEIAAGLPVVATNVGATPILVQDGVNGYLVEAGNSDALAEAIMLLAANPNLREQMGAAARHRATDFSWERCLDNYEALLVSLVRKPRARSVEESKA